MGASKGLDACFALPLLAPPPPRPPILRSIFPSWMTFIWGNNNSPTQCDQRKKPSGSSTYEHCCIRTSVSLLFSPIRQVTDPTHLFPSWLTDVNGVNRHGLLKECTKFLFVRVEQNNFWVAVRSNNQQAGLAPSSIKYFTCPSSFLSGAPVRPHKQTTRTMGGMLVSQYTYNIASTTKK